MSGLACFADLVDCLGSLVGFIGFVELAQLGWIVSLLGRFVWVDSVALQLVILR